MLLHFAEWSSRYFGNIRLPLQYGNPSSWVRFNRLELNALAALERHAADNRFAVLQQRLAAGPFVVRAACPHPANRCAGVLVHDAFRGVGNVASSTDRR
jgi:hypothetical protein